MLRRLLLPAFIALSLTSGACEADADSHQRSETFQRPRMDFEPATNPIAIVDSTFEVHETYDVVVRVVNIGNATLTLKDVSLLYVAPAGAVESQPAFRLRDPDPRLSTSIEPKGGDALPQQLDVVITYTRQPDELRRLATLVLKSDDPFIEDGTLTIDLQTISGATALSTSSKILFPVVPLGQTEARAIAIANTGSETLHITGFRISGDERFGVKSDSYDFELSGSRDGITLDAPLEVEAGASVEISVTFESDTSSPAEGELFIYSDDPASGTTGFVVDLEAN